MKLLLLAAPSLAPVQCPAIHCSSTAAQPQPWPPCSRTPDPWVLPSFPVQNILAQHQTEVLKEENPCHEARAPLALLDKHPLALFPEGPHVQH